MHLRFAACFVTEGDNAMPVLKPDRARGLEARRGEAHEFVEEDAAVRVASAFWHEFKATPRPPPVRYHDTTSNRGSQLPPKRAKVGWKLSLDGNSVESGAPRFIRASSGRHQLPSITRRRFLERRVIASLRSSIVTSVQAAAIPSALSPLASSDVRLSRLVPIRDKRAPRRVIASSLLAMNGRLSGKDLFACFSIRLRGQ